MDYQTITVTEAAGVVTITMNRPAVMNALDTAMRAGLRAALTGLPAGTRAVVLTGTGRAFCSWQDLGDRAPGTAFDLEQSLTEDYAPLVRAIADCPVPVLAAVNGAAAGAGASLALACDIVVAAESAYFLMAFARIGLIPDAGATWTLPRRVGHARAAGAMMLAERIPARQAADWGMIWEAVPDDVFAEAVAARAAALAAGPTGAYRAMRAALCASWTNDLDAQLALEARLQGGRGRSADFVEGLAAFRDKRPALFRGD